MIAAANHFANPTTAIALPESSHEPDAIHLVGVRDEPTDHFR